MPASFCCACPDRGQHGLKTPCARAPFFFTPLGAFMQSLELGREKGPDKLDDDVYQFWAKATNTVSLPFLNGWLLRPL